MAIPRRYTPLQKPETQKVADDAPLVETRFIDYDFNFGPQDTVSVTLSVGSANGKDDTIEESASGWTIQYRSGAASGETVTIDRSKVRWVSKRERVVTTPAPIVHPTIQ